MKEPTLSNFLFTLGLIALGLVLLELSTVASPPEAGLFAFTLAIGFLLVGCADVLLRIRLLEKIRLQTRKNANRGIVWVWVVFAITVFIFAIIYISVSWPVMLALDLIEGSYSFSLLQKSVFSTIRTVFAWVGIIFLFGMIMWALVNSARREEATYPVYNQ